MNAAHAKTGGLQRARALARQHALHAPPRIDPLVLDHPGNVEHHQAEQQIGRRAVHRVEHVLQCAVDPTPARQRHAPEARSVWPGRARTNAS